jgi:hypothetical protein
MSKKCHFTFSEEAVTVSGTFCGSSFGLHRCVDDDDDDVDDDDPDILFSISS